MTCITVSCPFEDCKHFGKIEHVEQNMYIKHLYRDHNRHDLIQFAFQKEIIHDPSQYHNFSYIVQKITEISKVNGDGCHGSS